MPNDLDKILAPATECLSNETLRAYLEGEIQNKQHVERHLVDCELCSTALEGFAAIPAFESVKDLNAEIKQRTAHSTGKNWFYFGVAAILGAVLLATTLYFLSDDPKNIENVELFEDPQMPQQLMDEDNTYELGTPVIENDEVALPIDPSIHERTVAQQPAVTIDENEADLIVRGSGPEKILVRRTDPELLRSSENERIRRPKVWSNVHIAFVHDLLIVDYSKILTSGVTSVEERYGSLHPRYENWQDRTIIKFEQRTYNVPYIEYMEGAMSGFSKGDPVKTLNALKELLEQRNNDVNGLFYSGLCLYHLDRPTEAIEHFDAAIASSVNTFYEEAKWYKALSLIKLKDDTAARSLLQEIVEEDGFYSDRAKEKLIDKKIP